MKKYNLHSFFIPVMGTAFTIDTPLKVAKYGISSVVSIGDDELCEEMRQYYSEKHGLPYEKIEKKGNNYYRSQRITAYLDLLQDLVDQDFNAVRQAPFEPGSESTKYFELLEDKTPLKQAYLRMLEIEDAAEKETAQFALREQMQVGDIDVNIMTKIDRRTYSSDGELLPEEFSDALAGLKGFAESKVEAGVVFSAGFNRRLYAYCAKFSGFFPDENGHIKKRIILKVSDFRSSVIQGKFLAKKGIWISEHRIESGLNCGGHAFATDGFLMGPILNEFLEKKDDLYRSLQKTCNDVLASEGKAIFKSIPSTDVTVQGGIGTSEERDFLLKYYDVAATGWASPFLLVPEVSTLDSETRELLQRSKGDDFYLSGNSPLGVPFNTVKNTASEQQKLERIEKGRPGSPCPKGHLISNTEFSKKPVCTASIFYQKRKLEELKAKNLDESRHKEAFNAIVEKTCLCEDLASPALTDYGIENKRPLKSTVCSGANLRYFSKKASLVEMVGHIYGRNNLLDQDVHRPNMLLNEFKMYIDFLEKEVKKVLPAPNEKQIKYLLEFKKNLQEGANYYQGLISELFNQLADYKESMNKDLEGLQSDLQALVQKHEPLFTAAKPVPA